MNDTIKYFLLIIILQLISLLSGAQSQSLNQISSIDTSGEALYVAKLERLSNELVQSQISFSYNFTYKNKYGFARDYIPTWPDSTYINRFEQLSAQTPITLEYNKVVKDYINLYANRSRKLTEKLLGLSYLYFPIIEEILDKYELPLELKYLAVIESGLNPVASSPSGAKGLWQFMYGTAKLYGLNMTSYVDERLDLYRSTDAACKHLKDLYGIYNDWLLVLAAYNAGTGNINKAIRRAGGKANYWQIYPYLTQQTRSYVPAFYAVLYVMNFPTEHNLFPDMPIITNFETDTIMINESLSFQQIHESSGTSLEEIKYLNPEYKQNIIPGNKDHPYTLKLPTDNILTFASNNKSYKNKTKPSITNVFSHDLFDNKKVDKSQFYIVKKGDCLSSIASKYNITVKQIISWNKLRNSSLKVGQKLIVSKN